MIEARDFSGMILCTDVDRTWINGWRAVYECVWDCWRGQHRTAVWTDLAILGFRGRGPSERWEGERSEVWTYGCSARGRKQEVKVNGSDGNGMWGRVDLTAGHKKRMEVSYDPILLYF